MPDTTTTNDTLTTTASPLREADIRNELQKQIDFYNLLHKKSEDVQAFFAAAESAGFEIVFVRK